MRGFECKIVEDLCIIVPILDISGACTSDRQPGVNDSPMVPPHHQHPPVVEKKAGLPTQEDAMAAKKKLATLQARSFCFLFFEIGGTLQKENLALQDFSGSNINARKKK